MYALFRQIRVVCGMRTELYCFRAVSTLRKIATGSFFWPPSGQTRARENARIIRIIDFTANISPDIS